MSKQRTETLHRLGQAGFTYDHALSLWRISLALSRWGERECGDGSNWAIERDETTGKPFNVYHGEGKPWRYRIADKEAGALRRLDAIISGYPSWVAYHQPDCRGCAVYVIPKDSLKPGDKLDQVYTRGIAV